MLKVLQIHNYAIIDQIKIDFAAKMNVITGETGAGKSILMGALSLILGERADTSILMHRDKKCYVEGIFIIDERNDIHTCLKDADLDADDELVIRREIATNGKSRAFVNDTPVTLEQLRRITGMLVDLHQQFDSRELGETGFQRQVLDALASHGHQLTQYQNTFLQLHNTRKELEDYYQQKKQFNKESDYNKFLFDELEEAAFKEDELEDLDKELQLLNNSEGIKTLLARIANELSEGETPIVYQLRSLVNQLQSFASYHSAIPLLVERIQSTHIELQDIAGEAESINNKIHYEPERLEEIHERISTGYRLLKKHGVQNTNELLSVQANLGSALQAILNIDDVILQKEKETVELTLQAQQIAAILSQNRVIKSMPFQEKVNELLIQVGMPNARLKVVIQAIPMNYYGIDNIEFLFDANKSGHYESIRKVASGGELSRLMLCIKSLVAQSLDLPTLIFDEIDSGISGEAARQVGMIMKDLAAKRQVICITHQPQIAGKADAHFFVYKELRNDLIKTNIRLLTNEERITTIAQMLGGEKPTAAAMENAREMVGDY